MTNFRLHSRLGVMAPWNRLKIGPLLCSIGAESSSIPPPPLSHTILTINVPYLCFKWGGEL